MLDNFTLTIVKPDAVKKGFSGKILNHIIESGFQIKALKLFLLQKNDAAKFYSIHRERPFFNNLLEFMISGPILASVLVKKNAVEDFRELIGETNPNLAKEGTIRKLYAESIERNAIHGSDSNESARIESLFYFSGREIF